MNYRYIHFLARAASLAATAALAAPCLAQTPPPALVTPPAPTSATPAPSASVLDMLRYDPQTDGVLIWIPENIGYSTEFFRSDRGREEARFLRAMTLRQFADRSACRLFNLPTITAMAPRDQRVIAEVPNKPADPLANLKITQRFGVLLSLLTREQWVTVTSAAGLGMADMTAEQQELWRSFLPLDKITVQKNKTIATGPGSYTYKQEGAEQEFAPDTARLRLVRRVHFSFKKSDSDDYGFSSDIDKQLREPDTAYTGNFDYAPDERNHGDGKTPEKTFGATILQAVPNRLKTCDLDLALPALGVGVPLGAKTETVGELLARVGAATGFDLRCDKRIVALSVIRRVTGNGLTVTASDLLQSVCLGVCGAFRKIERVGEPVYLLTYDREGIATRLLRWSDWAEEADSKQYKLLEGVTSKVATLDPLGLIGFAPNDPYALPPALLATVDKAYRAERFGFAAGMPMSELPPNLREEAQSSMNRWIQSGDPLDTQKVRLDTQLTCQLVLPGGIAVEPSSYGRNLGGQYLQKIARPEDRPTSKSGKSAKLEPLTKPVILSAMTGHRVLLLPFPPDAAGVRLLLKTAERKGFGEVWLRVKLTGGGANQTARLASAVANGARSGVRVGAVVDVLRGYEGTPDVNLLGETGAEFAKRRQANNPYYSTRFPGWSVWDGAAIRAGLLPLARVPGLAALALQATAAPGYAGVVRGGDGLPPGGHLGYTTAERLACLEARGYDPLDAADYSYTLGVQVDLPFFAKGELWDDLGAFRWTQNKRDMASLHVALKTAAPKLLVYLNDRASSYARPNTSWYVGWVKGDSIAVCPLYWEESAHRTAAFAASPEPLLNQWGWDGKPADFAGAVAKSFTAARRWRGVVVDCSYLTPEVAARMLGGIADAAPP